MGGERNLSRLLETLSPVQRPGRFVFTPVRQPVPDLDVIAMVQEPEGTTIVVGQDAADSHGLTYDFVAAMITLEVESALDAVGLTAAVTSSLAGAGISCNVIAGYHHDHLFVPFDRVDEALTVLQNLSGVTTQ